MKRIIAFSKEFKWHKRKKDEESEFQQNCNSNNHLFYEEDEFRFLDKDLLHTPFIKK